MSEHNESQSAERPCVLVVEDSPTTRVVIERHLKQYFDLITAADGQEAWNLLQNDEKIELVITDINMPNMSGIQLLHNIRSSNQSRINQLPVFIMTSADDDESDKHQALDLGANDFITKPINPIVLRARVNVHHRLAKATQHMQHAEAGAVTSGAVTAISIKTKEQFEKDAAHEFSVAQNEDVALSLIMLDIDRFTDIRGSHGENVLQEIVQAVSDVLTRLLRGIDAGAYMGNGRYEILLPGTRRLGAAVVAERMRTAIEQLESTTENKADVSATVSVAMATIPAEKVNSLEELRAICEKRLNIAHELGHNRICVNDEGHTSFSRT